MRLLCLDVQGRKNKEHVSFDAHKMFHDMMFETEALLGKMLIIYLFTYYFIFLKRDETTCKNIYLPTREEKCLFDF